MNRPADGTIALQRVARGLWTDTLGSAAVKMKTRPWKRRALKRPAPVTTAALAALLVTIAYLVQVAEPLLRGGIPQSYLLAPVFLTGRLSELQVTYLIGIADLLLGLIALILVFSLLAMRRWAWVALMLWAIFNMTLNLIRYFYGQPRYVLTLLSVVMVFALAQGDVRHAFGIRLGPYETRR